TWLLPEDPEAGVAIRPDPVGDHLLITALDHDPDFLVDLLRTPEPSRPPGQPTPRAYPSSDDASFRACAVLSRAAQWHEYGARLAAAHLLHSLPSLWRPALAIALRVAGPFALALREQAERQFATEAGAQPEADASLPWQLLSASIPLRHSALAELALIASQALLRHVRTDDDEMSTAERAGSLNNLGIRLSEAGRREEALAPAQEAVTLRRQLAQANPAAHTPNLAMSLNNLGNQLSGAGRREEALAPAQEAVTLYRQLAQANPAAHPPDLAAALNNLGNQLSGAGRREEALAPAQEAVTLYRQLAQANPAAHTPDLAAALNNLGNQLSGAGRREEALAPAQEAVTLYRQLAQANPAAHTPDLAAALNNLGHQLSEAGRLEEALAPAQEAVTLRRQLAQANPAAHTPDLAASLNNLGNQLSEAGRREEALA